MMRLIRAIAALWFLSVAGCATVQQRTVKPFDADWRFLKADAHGAEQSQFDDAAWVHVDVPHDWAIAGPVDREAPAGGAGAFLPSGVAWYRKTFVLPDNDSARRVFIDFDGVMANSDVWINGFHLGHRPNGYVSFRYELTGHLQFGDTALNVIAVCADTSAQPASRWYAGAGIYRHVRLVVTDSVHFEHDGTFVTTPRISSDEATVHVHAAVVNQSEKAADVRVRTTLLDPSGNKVATLESESENIAAAATGSFDQNFVVKPQLWDLDYPNLYRAVTEARASGKTVDDDTVVFGIRDAEFKSDSGFWLNGKNIKLKGVCLHGDAGGLGVAVPLAAWAHRLSALKAIGANAIRTAHNPPSPEFLDLCDRMGFLVMDEMFDCWTVAKNPYDYHLYFRDWSTIDTRDTARRDRNHPSIILYSAGNEIHDTPKSAIAIPILKSLVATLHENDPTRPVTQALFRPNVSHDYTNGLADLLDVVGTNYRDSELLAAHEAKPSRKIVGTENGPELAAWAEVRDHPEYSGQFVWTGVDYLGESRRWPNVQHESGFLDIADAPRPIAFQRQSWWTDAPMLEVARDEGTVATGNIAGEPKARARQYSDWTPGSLRPHREKVIAFSNCEQVELFLNGTSLGVQGKPADGSPRIWSVNFEPGVLKAVAKNNGAIIATQELRTAGKPTKIVLSIDRSKLKNSWDDVAYATVLTCDANNIVNPASTDSVTFSVDGAGKIAAVENGDLASHESFQGNVHQAFRGRCVAIVRAAAATGTFTLTASAPGLESGSVIVQIVPVEGAGYLHN